MVLVGATASDPEEGVLSAVLEALGPLRAAAISVSDEGGAVHGAAQHSATSLRRGSDAASREARAAPAVGLSTACPHPTPGMCMSVMPLPAHSPRHPGCASSRVMPVPVPARTTGAEV